MTGSSMRCLFALALLLGFCDAGANWQITRFVAYEGPAIDAPGWRELEAGREQPKFPRQLLREIELFLEQVATEYSNLGFADPVAAGWIDSVVRDASGQPEIRFYLYKSDNPKAPQGWFTSGTECGDYTSRKALMINTAKFAPKVAGVPVIRGNDWATLAHELMHPVIQASRFMRGRCAVGKWISEGIPDAVSFDVTRKFRKTDFPEAMPPDNTALLLKLFGLRSYGHPLQDHVQGDRAPAGERSDINYLTSSFWRYLAETKYVKSRYPNRAYPSSRATAGPGASRVDYRFIAELFDTPHPYSPDPNRANPLGDIRWVAEFLKSEKHIKSSLPRMHARFVSALADYREARVGPAREAHKFDAPDSEIWMQVLFNGCEQADSPIGGFEQARASIRLLPNGAACIQVHSAGPLAPDTAVVVQTLHNDLQLLKQLRMGLPDGTIVSGPEIFSFVEEQPPYIAKWTFPLFAVRENTYILANMSPQPHRSRHYAGDFFFSLGTWESDLTTVPMPPPAAPPAAKQGPGRPTKQEAVKKNAELALVEPMQRLLPAGSVDLEGYAKPVNCDPVRLRLNLCGPRLVISLDISPSGTAPTLRGSDAISMYRQASAFDPANPMASMQRYAAAYAAVEAELEAADGTRIRIGIPRIDYGFTGSFYNADISVSKGNSPDRGYQAYGPPVDDGIRKHWRPPNGKVTIEEYSHLVLRGSFSADLIDESKRESAERPVIAKTISGRFSIPAPYEGDDDFGLVAEQFEGEMIQSMLESMPTGFAPMQEVIRQSGTPPAILCQKLDRFQLRAMGMEAACRGVTGGREIGAESGQCGCACDARQQEKPRPECRSECERAWGQCPPAQVALSGTLAEEIAHYRALMEAKGLPKALQDPLIDSYQKSPAWQRKLILQGYQ